MSSYYPFGEKIVPTKEELEKESKIFEQYDYYGISYGLFDSYEMGEGYRSDKDVDRDNARLYIAKGEPIPADLAERLLLYKEQDRQGKQSEMVAK